MNSEKLAKISACHADDRGSNPRGRTKYFQKKGKLRIAISRPWSSGLGLEASNLSTRVQKFKYLI